MTKWIMILEIINRVLNLFRKTKQEKLQKREDLNKKAIEQMNTDMEEINEKYKKRIDEISNAESAADIANSFNKL